MRRSDAVLLAALVCTACAERATLAERPRAANGERPRAANGERPRAANAAPPNTATVPELSSLAMVARSGRPSEPVRIVAPDAEAELDPAAASSLVVAVSGPSDPGTSLVLSLDGARPRPVTSGTLAALKLLDADAALAPGPHDLVLAAVNANGVALEPSAGGVASLRFYVGARRAAAPARVVCLSPFGTVYGAAPSIALDFVVVAGARADAVVTLESAGVSRRVRASGAGPFALGDLTAGDHELSIALAGGVPAVPGHCGFAYNPELERPR